MMMTCFVLCEIGVKELQARAVIRHGAGCARGASDDAERLEGQGVAGTTHCRPALD